MRKKAKPKRTIKEDIAIGILLWRYIDHSAVLVNTAFDKSLRQATRGLAMAKQAGVRDEYLRLMMEFPVMNVKVKELE